jgi:diguanylate cyclase (GGDEF)-like protein/PAS domain S-box-containing protein
MTTTSSVLDVPLSQLRGVTRERGAIRPESWLARALDSAGGLPQTQPTTIARLAVALGAPTGLQSLPADTVLGETRLGVVSGAADPASDRREPVAAEPAYPYAGAASAPTAGHLEHAQAALEAIHDAVISADTDWRVTYLNPAAEDLCGWSAGHATGREVAEVCRIVEPDARRDIGPQLVAAILEHDGHAAALPSLLLRRDGSEVEVDVSAAPIRARTGSVVGAVLVLREAGAARQLSRRLSRMAYHDPLTDLANRALLADRLQLAIALAHRKRHSLAVLFLDVDHFKELNDSMGHGVGDILLASIARRLSGCVRGSDTVCRFGGDEFVVVLNEVNQPGDVAATAEKLRHAVATPHYVSGRTLTTTVSIGVATYPADGLDATTLLRNADAAMYRAKASGRNNHQAYAGPGPLPELTPASTAGVARAPWSHPQPLQLERASPGGTPELG